MKLRLLVASLALSACATGPQTPATTIYQVENSYNVAATVIIAYKNLPVCGQVAVTLLCHKPEVVVQLKKADAVAYDAIVAAQNVARTPGAGANAATALVAAQQAVTALTSITTTLTVK